MKLWAKLLELILSNERRKAHRRPSPKLAAFFWTGGAPLQHGIRDISATGLYLLTTERWYPGTLILLTLQKRGAPEGSVDRSIAVQSKAVRWGEDGVGLEFVVPKHSDRGPGLLDAGTNRKALDRFLDGLTSEHAYATVNRVF